MDVTVREAGTNVDTDAAHRNVNVGSAVLAHVVEWALEQDLEGISA